MSRSYEHIRYSQHAREQMLERRISRRQVERTLNEPDSVYPGHSGRLIAERHTTAGNRIRVVYVEREDRMEVVTAIVVTVIRTTGTR